MIKRLFSEHCEIRFMVCVVEEYLLSVIAPLSDMVWNSREHYARSVA